MKSSTLQVETNYSTKTSVFTAKKSARMFNGNDSDNFPVRCLAADEDCSEIWAGTDNEPSSLLNTSSICRQSISMEPPLAQISDSNVNNFLKAEIRQFRSEIVKLENSLAQAERTANEREEFVFFLQGKYRDKASLEELRGERLLSLHKRVSELEQAMGEKDEVILSLVAEKSDLELQLSSLQLQVEENTKNIQDKIDLNLHISSADRRQRERAFSDMKKMNDQINFLEDALKLEKEETSRLRSELFLQKENEKLKEKDLQCLYTKLNRLQDIKYIPEFTEKPFRLQEENAELHALLEQERSDNLSQLDALKQKVQMLQARTVIMLNKNTQTDDFVTQGTDRGCQVDTVTPLYKKVVADALNFDALLSSKVRKSLDAPELVPTPQSLELGVLTSSLRAICLTTNSLASRLCKATIDSGMITDILSSHIDASVFQASSLRQELRKKERATLKLYNELKEAKIDATKLALKNEELKIKLKKSARTARSVSPINKTVVRFSPQKRPFFELLTPEETLSTFCLLLQKISDSDRFVKNLSLNEDMKTLLHNLFRK